LARYILPDTIAQGDARDLLRRVARSSVALSFWSPPYFVGKAYEAHLTFEGWKALLADVILQHERVLKDLLGLPDRKYDRLVANQVIY